MYYLYSLEASRDTSDIMDLTMPSSNIGIATSTSAFDHAYCSQHSHGQSTSDEGGVKNVACSNNEYAAAELVQMYDNSIVHDNMDVMQSDIESDIIIDCIQADDSCIYRDAVLSMEKDMPEADDPATDSVVECLSDINVDDASTNAGVQSIDLLKTVIHKLDMEESDQFKGNYVIVHKERLFELLHVCCVSGCTAKVRRRSEIVLGSCLKVRITCEAGHVRKWESSPMLRDSKGTEFSEVNVALSAAILFSGNHYEKIKRLFDCLNMPIVTDGTFTDLSKVHVYPVIDDWSQCMQEALFSFIGDKPIALAGDGRADSPGFSAQFCLYSFEYGEYVLHSELVDKRETQLKSTNMEKLACMRGLLYLMDRVTISHLVTDAHTQIRAMFKKDGRFKDIVHQFDIFHKSVKIHTKLLECANQRGNSALREFIPSIRNHFWYSAQRCMGDSQRMVDLWVSVLRHLVGEHVWFDGQCEHDVLPEDAPTLDIASSAMDGLRQIVLDKKLLKEFEYYRCFMHTFRLESFHNEVLVYAPKRVSFSYEGMKARCRLAILDHNFHQGRPDRINKGGEKMFTRKWSKRSKHWVSVTLKMPKQYLYLPYMMSSVIKHRTQSEQPYKKIARLQSSNLPSNHPKCIARNLAELPAISSDVLAKEHDSRFSNNKVARCKK